MIVASISGVNLELSRYEVLGADVVAALGLIPVALFTRLGWKVWCIIATNLSIALLSVTRTQLVVSVVQCITCIFFMPSILRHPKRLINLLAFISLPTAVIAADIMTGTGSF
jgi:hypothetical protein